MGELDLERDIALLVLSQLCLQRRQCIVIRKLRRLEGGQLGGECVGQIEPPAALLIDQGRLDSQVFLGGAALGEFIAVRPVHLLGPLQLPGEVVGALARERRPQFGFLASLDELRQRRTCRMDLLLALGELVGECNVPLGDRALAGERIVL